MRTIVADISHWEGIVDWSIAWRWLPAVYYKATDGLYYIDSQLGNNHDGCMEYGVPHAPYHWWQEMLDPIAQADHFCDTLEEIGDGYKKEIIDVEPKGISSSFQLKKLLDRVAYRRGRLPAIYTSAYKWSLVQPTPSWANDYDLLCANYKYGLNPTIPASWGKSRLKVWQFTDYYWFPGCESTADGNWFYGDLTETRDWFGNYKDIGLPTPIPPPPADGKTVMRVTADKLNIRSNPWVANNVIGQLNKGETAKILDVAGQDAWIKHEKGWSAVKVGNYVYMFPEDQNIFNYLPVVVNE